MASNLIEVILKAVNQTDGAASQAEKNLKKIETSATNANKKIAEGGLSAEKAIDTYYEIGSKGSASFEKLTKSEQKAISLLEKMDDEARNTMLAYHELGRETPLFSQFEKAIADTNSWSGALDSAKAKLSLLGTDTDSLKGKIQVVGNAIPQYLGSKWDSIKSKVTTFGSFIKSNLTSALSTVRGKIESLGNAFSGLGGIISGVFGGIGLKSMADMTIGASINRDRIFNLSYAILGADQSMKQFKESSDSLWNKMDADTNKSLVGLDQISQAMSVINMSANASESQLKALEPIVLDIGQRAILMGKSGDEAVSLMQAAGKGLNGEFEMLRENLGITKDKLEAAGWDGSASDIDGYTKALGDCLSKSGDVSDMMNTTSGKLTRLQKYWGLAGRSLGDQFLPYVDLALDHLVKFFDADDDGALDQRGKQWMQYAYGAMAVASGFATMAPSIAPALSVLDNLTGKTKSALQFLGLMEAKEGALTLAILKETLAQKMNTIAKAAGGTAAVAEAGANAGLTASFMAMSGAILTNPLTWLVVALIAVAVAVYKVGESFGWWKDVPGMLSAVWSGIQRLWSAFINHPDVQAALSNVWSALQWIGSGVMWVGGKLAEFFNIQTSGKWDVVSSIIHGIGNAWNTLKPAIMTAMSILSSFYNAAVPVGQGIYEALKPIVCILLGCSPGIVPAVREVFSVFTSVWNSIMAFISPIIQIIVNAVNRLINAFKMFLNGQLSLPGLIFTVLATLLSTYQTILLSIVNAVVKFAGKMLTQAIRAGRNFVNGVINHVTSLPGKVSSILLRVVNTIISIGQQWVSSAVSKAKSIVSTVYNTLTSLPGKIASAVSGVKDALVKPFREAYDRIRGIVENIKNFDIGSITNFFANEGVDMYGNIVRDGVVIGNVNDTNTTSSSVAGSVETVQVDHNINLTLDLKNVPASMDENTLISMLNDKKVISSLVSNNTFQELDKSVKNALNARNRRARGA